MPILTNEELTELYCEFDDETQYNYSRALESKILERVIGIADKARLALSDTYGKKLAEGESELNGNMDWARLQGAVRVVEVLRRLR